MSAPPRPRPRLRAVAAAAVALAAVLAGSVDVSRAASAGVLTIVSAEHDPAGRIYASVAPANPAQELALIDALVDGVPRSVEVTRRPALPASVVIAIDTSGSMAGDSLLAARSAALALIQQLAPDDQVAVVAFADAPVLVSPFEAGRQSAVDQVNSLLAQGGTSLHGALVDSVSVLNGRIGPRAVVVLSDGRQDATKPGTVNVDQGTAVDAVVASGVPIYAVALGASADHAFLESIAQSSGGDFWRVDEPSALGELFAHLGSHLGSSSTEITISVPPLAMGTHRLEVLASAGGEDLQGLIDLPVTNDGLMEVAPRASEGGTGRPIVIDVTALAPLGGLRFEATALGTDLTVLEHPTRIAIDPWAFAPGALDVEVRAMAQDGLAGSATVGVAVPILAPSIGIEVVEVSGAREAVIRGRVQGDTDATIETSIDGEVVEAGIGPELRVPLPESGGALLARLIVDGEEVATAAEAVGVAPAPSALPISTLLALLAVAGALTLLAYGLVRVRRNRRPPEWEPNGQTMLVGRRAISTVEAQRPRGAIIVRQPNGQERRYEICRAPLSLGSAETCDIVLHDRAVGGVHARLYALGAGEFRIHGIAPRSAPFNTAADDEWMLVRHGEQIAIGEHLLTILDVEEHQGVA